MLEGSDYFWLKDFDCAPLPAERDSIHLLFCLHFRDLCFVAEETATHRPVGFVLGLNSTEGHVAHVHALFVDAAHRGGTLGRELMERFVAASRGAGCRYVVLYTVRAAEFYTRLGFSRGWPALQPAIQFHIEQERGAICMFRAL